jgi:hypothetical protein
VKFDIAPIGRSGMFPGSRFRDSFSRSANVGFR